MKIPPKEQKDEQTIDSALKRASKLDHESLSQSDYLEVHLVYTGYYYYFYHENRLRWFIRKRMEKHKIRSVTLTILYMQRWNLITKETMENHRKQNESIDDDLETFYRDLQNGRKSESSSNTYYSLKLSEKELKLVDENDLNYFKSFRSENPDVDKVEMQNSTSESKFVKGQAWRKTSIIDSSFTQNCCSHQ